MSGGVRSATTEADALKRAKKVVRHIVEKHQKRAAEIGAARDVILVRHRKLALQARAMGECANAAGVLLELGKDRAAAQVLAYVREIQIDVMRAEVCAEMADDGTCPHDGGRMVVDG
jgi:hypothetical protein